MNSKTREPDEEGAGPRAEREVVGPRLRIGFAQTEPRFGDVPGNLEKAARRIEKADPFDLLVLPELFSTGYAFRDRDELATYAEDPSGPTIQFLITTAARTGAWIAGGFAERDGDRLFNSAALAGPDGSIRVYRKIHLFDREMTLFDPGDRPFEAYEIEVGGNAVRVGMMICFDWIFPESARCLALEGAEILLHPSNLVLSICQDAMPTRCLENAVFAITANRVGADDRGGIAVSFTGRSQITHPSGRVLANAPSLGECTRVVEANIGWARDKYITDRNHRLGDRRPELYARLVRDSPR